MSRDMNLAEMIFRAGGKPVLPQGRGRGAPRIALPSFHTSLRERTMRTGSVSGIESCPLFSPQQVCSRFLAGFDYDVVLLATDKAVRPHQSADVCQPEQYRVHAITRDWQRDWLIQIANRHQ